MIKLKVGDKMYNEYFKQTITIVAINSDRDWLFSLEDGTILKAQTPLSYFELKLLERSKL